MLKDLSTTLKVNRHRLFDYLSLKGEYMNIGNEIWVTVSNSLNLDDDYDKQNLLVSSFKDFKTLLKLCEQSKKCLSVVFDFRKESK